MLLPFKELAENGLTETSKYDAEMAALADRHYSRQSVGARQFMPNGKSLILRNGAGTILFGWVKHRRSDGQEGYNCCIFRNESKRLSSEIILEAEEKVVERWGPGRGFTYVDAGKIKSVNPGYCFKMAGWKFGGRSKKRKRILLVKEELGKKPEPDRSGFQVAKAAGVCTLVERGGTG